MTNMHENWGDVMNTGMGIGMWVFWIVAIVAVLLIAKVLLVNNSPSLSNYSETVMDILKKRFATGEINQDEFERMKKELEG